MKKLYIISFIVGSLNAGIISDTSMSIATESLIPFIDANMKTIITQAEQNKNDYKQSVLKSTQEKDKKLQQIKILETQILLELENIKFNQEKINQIEVLIK